MSILDAVRAAERQGKLDKALALARKAVIKTPADAAAWLLLGEMLSRHQSWPETIEAGQHAANLVPDNAEAHFLIARAAYESRRLDLAESAYFKVLEKLPGHLATLCNLGVVYSVSERLGEAADCYRKALAACPSELRAGITYNLGQTLVKQGRHDEAMPVFQDAIAANPDLCAAHLALGNTLYELKRMPEAAEAYRRALDLDPDAAEPHFKLGQTLLALGRLEEAEAEVRHYVRLRPTESNAYEALGRILILLDRRCALDGVLKDWELSLPGDPRLAHIKAAWAAEPTPPRASDGYVRQVFDNFANHFEATLKELDYRAPEKLVATLADHLGLRSAALDVLDAGCGTGLCGPLLRPMARRLVGVDLSPGMLARAADRSVYDQLIEAELCTYLAQTDERFDVIVSADTLVYFGDLTPVMTAAATRLTARGMLFFSLEHADEMDAEPGYRLNPHGRYAHTIGYVQRSLSSAGLNCVRVAEDVLRKEAGMPVPGLLIIATKTA